MRKIVLGLSAALLVGASAMAQEPLTYAQVDTDGNGELSYEELKLVWPDLADTEFADADRDGSGGLSVEELNALQSSALPAPEDTAPETAPAPQG